MFPSESVAFTVRVVEAPGVEFVSVNVLENSVAGPFQTNNSSSPRVAWIFVRKPLVAAVKIVSSPEWITVMENGLTFVPKNDEMLAFLIGKLLDDPELRMRLGEQAFEKVSTRAVWEDNMVDVEAAFLDVLRKHK